MFGNRALYQDGWFARVLHRAPSQTGKQKPLEDDVWDLYNVKEDFSLVNNLADEYPERVAAMEATFMEEAEKYNVLPMPTHTSPRLQPPARRIKTANRDFRRSPALPVRVRCRSVRWATALLDSLTR